MNTNAENFIGLHRVKRCSSWWRSALVISSGNDPVHQKSILIENIARDYVCKQRRVDAIPIDIEDARISEAGFTKCET